MTSIGHGLGGSRRTAGAGVSGVLARLARALAVPIAALLLCWAALLNGQPFFHTDTQSYVRGPDVGVASVLGERFATGWARKAPPANDDRVSGAAAARASQEDAEVQSGRSIYYGLLAYLGHLAGGFWLTVFIQGLAVAALVRIVLQAAGVSGLRAYAGTMALLTLATPAPFFVGLLMPDIWTGVALGAVAALLAFPARLGWPERLALSAMTVFGALAHNSTPLGLVLLAAAGGSLWLLRRRQGPDARPALVLTGVALAAAALGAALFSFAVERAFGQPPVMAPFLTARMVEDGPGTRFIKERCGGEFVVCRYADRLPLKVDDFLWEYDPSRGVFQTVPSDQRRALGEEQKRFALAVAAAYPLQQTAASLKNIARQLVEIELEDFAYAPVHKVTLQTQLPEPHLGRMRASPAFQGTLPLNAFEALHAATALGALLLILGLLWRARGAGSDGRSLRVFAIAVGAALLANGAVCGALSALHGRYQARVVWLLPLAAAVLAGAQARARPEPLRLAPR